MHYWHTLFLLLIWAFNSVESYNLTETEVLEYKFPKSMRESLPNYVSGYDGDGAPIWIVEFGSWDIRKYVETGEESREQMDIYFDQMLYRFRKSAQDSDAKKLSIIADLDNFGFRQASHLPTLQFIHSKLKKGEEVIGHGYIKKAWLLYAHFLFQTVWKVGKPLVPILSEFIEVYGSYKDTWEPHIRRSLPLDQFPKRYGGSRD